MERKIPSHPRFERFKDLAEYVEREALNRAKRRFLETLGRDDSSRAVPLDVKTLELKGSAWARI